MAPNDASLRTTTSATGTRATRARRARAPAGLDSALLTRFAIIAVCHSDEPISAGLTISVPGRAPETIEATDDVPVRADWLQHELQQGPAVSREWGSLLLCKDLGAAERWPDFGRMCVAVLELRSMANVAVTIHEGRASLNFYSTEPTAFDHFDVVAALCLARLAEPAARTAIRAMGSAHAELPHTDASKAAIALATLMAQHRVGPTEGFTLLQEAALCSGRSLFDVAVDVAQKGRLAEEAITQTGEITARNPEQP